jgi:hypothetical protein
MGATTRSGGGIVFFDAEGLSIESATNGLRALFLPDGLFIAHQVRVPEVFLAAEDQLTSDDHCFHEFESVEATSDAPNDPCSRTIREFMAEVAEEAKRGWCAFNPQDRLPLRSRRFAF